MSEHPIKSLMETAMENIQEMVDVNTIVGEPVETPDGHVIIPVSKVGFGFAAGGSEFAFHGLERRSEDEHELDSTSTASFPFGGGSGGGVSITPVAFIVVGEKEIKLMSMESPSHLYERLIDFAPQLVEKLQDWSKRKKKSNCKIVKVEEED